MRREKKLKLKICAAAKALYNSSGLCQNFFYDYEKVYVAVTLKVDREGNVRPLSFEWEDGRVFA